MKRLIAVAFCLLAAGAVSAQNNAPAKKSAAPQNGAAAKAGNSKHNSSAVGGFILDARRHPLADVHAFIYAPDSSIIASGYTDAKGYYETNSVMPGKYTVKIVYPSYKAVTISGVVIKAGVTPITIAAAEPLADTTLPFANFVPVAEKKKPGAAKKQ